MTRKLVAYFSATGVTRKLAAILAEAIGADIYEIKPETPYTKADLNWMNKKSRSSLEMNDPSSRPAIVMDHLNFQAYDEIYLGFPIWWYVAPHIINTFLESYNFSEKNIILFATSGSSAWGNTLGALETSVRGDAQLTEGKIFNGVMKQKRMKKWAEELMVQ